MRQDHVVKCACAYVAAEYGRGAVVGEAAGAVFASNAGTTPGVIAAAHDIASRYECARAGDAGTFPLADLVAPMVRAGSTGH
ncbi:hypothetical protein D3C84_848970 [compost metagenome]